MVNYPNDFDTDAEIPRVDDNITEIGGEVINALREAVFALEEAIGLLPQGTATDLAERLDQSLDGNGNIKASALSTAGIITAPITDGDVHANAGIEESKLDLDYSTVQLKTWIDALRVLVTELQVKVAQDIANLTAHTAHPATYGRHRAADVDAYGGNYDGYEVQGVIDDIDARIDAHLADPVDAHAASAISVDNNPLTSVTATDAQSAIEQLEKLQLRDVIRHQDRQHSNGVLRAQDVFADGRNGTELVPPSAAASGSLGDDFVRFATAPDSQAFESIRRGDKVVLVLAGTTYTFRVRSTSSPLTVNIFGTVPAAGAGTVSVYRSEEETEAPSSMVMALRNANLANRASTVQLVHPDAAFLLGNGFKGASLSSSARYLRVRYPDGDTGDLDIYSEMSSFSSVPSSWTVENVARILNEELFTPESGSSAHHPLIAFSYLGELGIAYDTPGPDGYVQIETPSGGNGAAQTLGFTEGQDAYGLSPRSSYIDGYSLSSVEKIVDAYGIITSSDTITVPNADLIGVGVKDGMVVRVSGAEEGSYVIKTVGADTLLFDTFFEHSFASSINKGVQVVIYADAFSLPAAPSDRTLYELFVEYSDAYGGSGKLNAAERATYADFGGFSAANLDLMAVSRDFAAGSRRVYWDASADTLEMGLPVGSTVTYTGPAVEVPSDPRGTIVRLYDGYGTDYVELQVAQTLPGVSGYMDIDIQDPISEERYIQVATVLHDKTEFKLLDDRRLFGTVGRNDVRDDFTRDYVSYPRSLLRGNGVIRGMGTTGVTTSIVELEGGEVVVDGKVKSIRSQSIPIPADGGTTYNLFVDRDGVVKLWQDDFFSSGVLATPSLAEIVAGDTETILAQVITNGSNVISDINDLRRFVGKIDDRIDLIVEENDITHGSFASFQAVVNWLAAHDSDMPVPRKLRVSGNVYVDDNIELPSHIVIEGDGYAVVTGARLTYTTSSAKLAIGNGTVIRDLAFLRSGTLSGGFIGGLTLDNVRIEGCGFIFASQALNNNAIVCNRMLESRISQCRFKNVGRGVSVSNFLYGSAVERNVFDGVHQNAIYVANTDGYGATDLTIAENIISTTTFNSGSDTALIRLESPQRTVFRHNSLSCDGTATAARPMLWVKNTSRFCHFIDNTFINTEASSQGFQKAMLFDGGGGSTNDHFFDTIRGNVISGFVGGSARGMDLTACDNTEIIGNFMWNCRQPFYADDCLWLKIVDNRFNSYDNATLVTIQGNQTRNIIFAYNTIGAGNILMNSRLMYVQNISPWVGGYIIGNNIWYQALVGTNSKAQLYVDGPEWFVAYNTIGSTSAFGLHTVESPLTISSNGDNCVLVHNNFNHTIIFGAPAKRTINNSSTLDQFNKGITYEVVIPLHQRKVDRDRSGNATWDDNVTAPYTDNTYTYYSTARDVIFAFGPNFVPTGALISNVKVLYSLTGAVTNLQTWMNKWIRGATGSAVQAATNVPSTGSSQTATITVSQRMEADTWYELGVQVTTGGVYTIYIQEVLITYVL